jgi:hypothetical protein
VLYQEEPPVHHTCTPPHPTAHPHIKIGPKRSADVCTGAGGRS